MTLIRSSENEALRKSCYEGLCSIGPFIAPQFIEVVNKRNMLAQLLGFVDFYDYKVQAAEGFGKATLFPILETLVQRARPILDDALEKLANEKGADELKPWNTSFALAGSLAKEKDPYFPFETAVNAWARSFAALGIKYEGATMQLDLSSFTSLATPGQVGSGLNALVTLMHEGGHAAHFANVRQPSPLFSQERVPTSIPCAENQSMFLDNLVGVAAWLARYAYSKDGQVIPWELIEKEIQNNAHVQYFPSYGSLLNSHLCFALADATEIEVQGIMSGRPLLAVPHPLTDESAAYMHGYVMAEMAVFQTRKHFLKVWQYCGPQERILG
ncbi:hypothetical protein BDR26DRAFT_1009834 [Obelidium mucronatum]|nr:hypothetical protein BDR26DRAFT_1009834 [Obelidium mucronatum]